MVIMGEQITEGAGNPIGQYRLKITDGCHRRKKEADQRLDIRPPSSKIQRFRIRQIAVPFRTGAVGGSGAA
jgi:hypothetical protein